MPAVFGVLKRTTTNVTTLVAVYALGIADMALLSVVDNRGGLLAQPIQAIWAKVLILIGVVIFIQWRPMGLFPPKGRLADV